MSRRSRSSGFARARKTEALFAGQLRQVARHIGEIVNGFGPDNPAIVPAMAQALEQYGAALRPWAEIVARRMIEDVSARDAKAWAELSAEMSRRLREEIRTAPTGATMRRLLAEQVDLIQSMPRKAAERVQELTLKAREDGTRAEEMVREIMRTGEVTASRARLIARTEVGRTATALTQARAQHVGSTTYVWRTSGDSDVRPSHKAMNGKPVRWDNPPTLDGLTGHAGALPNCRCYPEPIVPDE